MLGNDESLLIIGSLNANENDRKLSRDSIRTVQYTDNSKTISEIPFFHAWGELGVSSLVWNPDNRFHFFLTTGNKLFEIELINKKIEEIIIPRLRGVHELSIIGGNLWITNTYFDEIISYDIQNRRVNRRIKLISKKKAVESATEAGMIDSVTQSVDKFHCNQVFETYDGETYVLVHHVTGKQLISIIAQKIIKGHGNGGVLDINSDKRIPLNLKAPHTVRKRNNQYWLLNSGHSSLNIYSPDWELIHKIKTSGWGRGADFSDVTKNYFCGISAIRARYLLANAPVAANQVEVFDLNFRKVCSFVVPDIEQLNNLYIVKNDIVERLLQLG